MTIVVFFMASCTQNKTPEFDHYGVYLQNGNEYVELKEGSTAKPIEIEVKDEVALYVYHPQAKTQEYVIHNFRHKYEFEISPVKDNDEIIKIIPGYLWGQFVIQIENDEVYPFRINDKKVTEKLKNWMLKIIGFYENKDYGNFLESAWPIEVKNEEIDELIKELETEESFDDWIALVKTHLDKIENGEETLFFEASGIELDKYGFYMYSGNGNWQWFAR